MSCSVHPAINHIQGQQRVVSLWSEISRKMTHHSWQNTTESIMTDIIRGLNAAHPHDMRYTTLPSSGGVL